MIEFTMNAERDDKHPNDMTEAELRAHAEHLGWSALDLAQDLSFVFEMCYAIQDEADFAAWLERDGITAFEAFTKMREEGVEFMHRAYEMAGFSREHRAAIGEVASAVSKAMGR